jgi:hypothetical protein
MRIFLAWSGDASEHVAELLHGWLPDVIQVLQPFMSSESVRSGQRWLTEIGASLEKTDFAILCMTPTNLDSAWIHFEAGAASKHVEKSRVCPLLLDLKQTDVGLPLSQFQNSALTSKASMRKVMDDMNEALGDKGLKPERLKTQFEKYWPDFEAGIAEAQRILAAEKKGHTTPKRTTDDILAEMLDAQKGTLSRLDAVSAQVTQILTAQLPGLGPLSGKSNLGIGLPNLGSGDVFTGALSGVAAGRSAASGQMDTSGSVPKTLLESLARKDPQPARRRPRFRRLTRPVK